MIIMMINTPHNNNYNKNDKTLNSNMQKLTQTSPMLVKS